MQSKEWNLEKKMIYQGRNKYQFVTPGNKQLLCKKDKCRYGSVKAFIVLFSLRSVTDTALRRDATEGFEQVSLPES